MNQRRPKVLAIDDDAIWLEQIPVILEDFADVQCAETIDAALREVELTFFDIVLLDLNFNNDSRTGLEVFRKIHSLDQGVSVIVISGETHPQRLIEVFNAGVSRFIPKPATPEAIRQAVRLVSEERQRERSAFEMNSSAGSMGKLNPLLGTSTVMRKLQKEVEDVIRFGCRDILIQGETGTGKELLAKHLASSMDSSGRFIAMHCGAINDGIAESELFGHVKGAFTGADKDRVGAFEAASGGFVFLDEIAEMPLIQQAKILRVIQERTVQRVGSFDQRKVNFRTISATHVDLSKAIKESKFREDLYFRLAKVVLKIPPLRDRKEDIPLLIKSMLNEIPKSQRKELTPDSITLLKQHPWPGNARQLRGVIDHLHLRVEGPTIREKDICEVLPELAQCTSKAIARSVLGAYSSSLVDKERKRFEDALFRSDGDRMKAAGLLGLTRATYFRRAKELGLVQQRLSNRIPATE